MIEPAEEIQELVARALAEDLGEGDITSEATVHEGARARARIVQKQPGVVFGLAVVAGTMRQCGVEQVDNLVVEGQWRDEVPTEVLLASGPARALLAAERTALNFLQRLSGVATASRKASELVAGTGARVIDTRKTTPGLRALEKAAVVVGGGVNHRMSLSDAALVKDNHVLAAGGVTAAFEAVRRAFPGLDVEVECDTVDQVKQVVEAGADLVLLDNMTDEQMREAVALCRPRGVRTEASGGLTLDRARAVAETGVDYLSIGALTHSAPVLDLGMDLL